MNGRWVLIRPWTGLSALAALLLGCDSSPVVVETPPPTVSVSQPVLRKVVDYDDYEGRIAAVDTAEVRARVRGHLTKINFKDGQIVKAGDLLFEIDRRPYQADYDRAKGQVRLQEAQLKLAIADYARAKKLAETPGAISQQDLDKYAAAQAQAEAALAAAKANLETYVLDLEFCRITAPIGGKTSRSLLTIGNLVNTAAGESLLTTITSIDPMYVYFDVDERSLLRYRRIFRKPSSKDGPEPSVKDLKIPVNVGLEGEEGFPHKGVIDFSDNRVNPSTGTIQMRGLLPNPARILDAGMRARVRVPVSDPHDSILVTERAVATDQGRKFVYVVDDQGVAARRDVKLDRLSDGLQIIREGLKPEDWVIVNGIQRVRDGMKIEPKRIAMPGASAQTSTEAPKT